MFRSLWMCGCTTCWSSPSTGPSASASSLTWRGRTSGRCSCTTWPLSRWSCSPGRPTSSGWGHWSWSSMTAVTPCWSWPSCWDTPTTTRSARLCSWCSHPSGSYQGERHQSTMLVKFFINFYLETAIGVWSSRGGFYNQPFLTRSDIQTTDRSSLLTTSSMVSSSFCNASTSSGHICYLRCVCFLLYNLHTPVIILVKIKKHETSFSVGNTPLSDQKWVCWRC